MSCLSSTSCRSFLPRCPAAGRSTLLSRSRGRARPSGAAALLWPPPPPTRSRSSPVARPLLPLAVGTLGRRRGGWDRAPPGRRAAGGAELPIGRRARPVGSSSCEGCGASSPDGEDATVPRRCATSDLGRRRIAPPVVMSGRSEVEEGHDVWVPRVIYLRERERSWA
jgi:hypothetical protein